MLIPPSLQAPPAPDAPPAWWREKGVPGLELVGEASFARFGTPYVAESFHADAATLRRRGVQGRKAVWEAIAKGRVASGCRLRFLVPLSAERRRTFFAKSLARTWPEPGFSMEQREVKAFLALVCRAMEPGDRQDYLFLPERGFWVRMGQEAPVHFPAGPLAEAIRTLEWEEDGENPGVMTRLLQGFANRLP